MPVVYALQALEESPEDAALPMACISASAAQADKHAYLYTLRLGHGLVTALDSDGDRVLVGMSGGVLLGLTLVRGSKGAGAQAQREAANLAAKGVDCSVLNALACGVVEFSDDEEEAEEEEED